MYNGYCMEPGPRGESEVLRPPAIVVSEMIKAAREGNIPGVCSGALELSQRQLTDPQREWLRGFGGENPKFREDLRRVICKSIDTNDQQQNREQVVESLRLANILGIADPIDNTPQESKDSQELRDILDDLENKYGLSIKEPSFLPTAESPTLKAEPPVEEQPEPQEEKKPVVLSPEMTKLVNRLAEALLKGNETEIDDLIAEIARSEDLGENGLDVSQVLDISKAVTDEIIQKKKGSIPETGILPEAGTLPEKQEKTPERLAEEGWQELREALWQAVLESDKTENLLVQPNKKPLLWKRLFEL